MITIANEQKRKTLMNIIELRKKQLELIDKLSQPIRDNIKILVEAYKGQTSLERAMKSTLYTTRYMRKAFGDKVEKV